MKQLQQVISTTRTAQQIHDTRERYNTIIVLVATAVMQCNEFVNAPALRIN